MVILILTVLVMSTAIFSKNTDLRLSNEELDFCNEKMSTMVENIEELETTFNIYSDKANKMVSIANNCVDLIYENMECFTLGEVSYCNVEISNSELNDFADENMANLI